jgi:hypothetical protein
LGNWLLLSHPLPKLKESLRSPQEGSPLASERLSICYAVPGHNLLQSAGPTRNVLSLAEALSPWANVTVAFRKVLEPISPQGFEVVEIQPDQAKPSRNVDDGAVSDMTIWEFIGYLGSIRRFIKERSHSYDILLEKSWILTGYMTSLCPLRWCQISSGCGMSLCRGRKTL